MKKGSEIFVGIDTAKAHNAVAVTEAGRDGEVWYLGTFDNTPDAVAKLVRKRSSRYEKLYFCYEAGSTGHRLYRRILLRYGADTLCQALSFSRTLCFCIPVIILPAIGFSRLQHAIYNICINAH